MFRTKLFGVVAGLTLAATGVSGAQTVTAKLTAPYAPNAGSVTAFGYYMSPYSGTVNGTTERFNCVDFFHDVTVGQVWTATVVNLGAAILNPSLLLSTRDGTPGVYSLGDALNIYEQVAWLTDQMPLNPASDKNRTIAVQTAIWSLANNAPSSPSSMQYANTGDFWANGGKVSTINATSTNTDPGSTGYWIYQAQTQSASQAAGYYDKFNILTDVNKANSNSVQEFIYSTPEPGTFVLIGTGLAMLMGLIVYSRRREELLGRGYSSGMLG